MRRRAFLDLANVKPVTPKLPFVPRVCVVDGCGKKYRSNGYCLKHMQRIRRHGDPLIVKIGGRVKGKGRKICYCGKIAVAKGFCRSHYNALAYANSKLEKLK